MKFEAKLKFYFELTNEDKLLKKKYSESFIDELKKLIHEEVIERMQEPLRHLVLYAIKNTFTKMTLDKKITYFNIESIFEDISFIPEITSEEDCDLHIKIDLKQFAYYLVDARHDEDEITVRARNLSFDEVKEHINEYYGSYYNNGDNFSANIGIERLYCATKLDTEMGIIMLKRSRLSYGKAILRVIELVYKGRESTIRNAKYLIKKLGLNQNRIIDYSRWVSFEAIYNNMETGYPDLSFDWSRFYSYTNTYLLSSEEAKEIIDLFSIEMVFRNYLQYTRDIDRYNDYLRGNIQHDYRSKAREIFRPFLKSNIYIMLGDRI